MKKFLPALLSCLVAVMLVSCSPVADNFSNRHPQLVAAPDSVSAMLADAADRASLSLEKLAAVEYSRSPGVNVGPAGNAPPELSRAVTVNWVGPVEPITKSMSDRASYKFRTVGSAPPNALVVSVDIENRPVIEVLRDIGLQLGTRADIKVDSQNRIVELQYAPNTGVGE